MTAHPGEIRRKVRRRRIHRGFVVAVSNVPMQARHLQATSVGNTAQILMRMSAHPGDIRRKVAFTHWQAGIPHLVSLSPRLTH
jgi:hypothetical protein